MKPIKLKNYKNEDITILIDSEACEIQYLNNTNKENQTPNCDYDGCIRPSKKFVEEHNFFVFLDHYMTEMVPNNDICYKIDDCKQITDPKEIEEVANIVVGYDNNDRDVYVGFIYKQSENNTFEKAEELVAESIDEALCDRGPYFSGIYPEGYAIVSIKKKHNIKAEDLIGKYFFEF